MCKEDPIGKIPLGKTRLRWDDRVKNDVITMESDM